MRNSFTFLIHQVITRILIRSIIRIIKSNHQLVKTKIITKKTKNKSDRSLEDKGNKQILHPSLKFNRRAPMGLRTI